ncbi:MAG: hypothetical protein ABJA81_09645 [Nocardioidaceae bacterium]
MTAQAGRPGPGDPMVVFCMDEFGPLNLEPHPGKQWAAVATGKGDPEAPRRRRRRATFTRPHGVRHLMAGYDLSTDRLSGHITTKKGRTEFLAFVRYLRSLHPPEVRIAIVLDNFSPHLSTKVDQRVGEWAEQNNVELAYTPYLPIVAEPDRGTVPGAALLRAGRHRSPLTRTAGLHDPPLHPLAEPSHPRRSTPRARKTCKRCLTRH